MKAYKGFNKDMTCRGFQYEIGKTYETDKAEMCSSGFHACENPLDCFGYYSPGTSKYCEVELEDNGQRRSDDTDTKVVGKKITIGAELSVPMLCKLHFEYVTSRCKPANSRVAGDNESASAGERGSASAGYCGSASAGDYGSASAGDYGSASAGERGSASAGDYGSASAGERGSAVSRGTSEVGENGVAVARGNGVKVKGGMGSVLVICEENSDDCNIKNYKVAIVDGKKIKENTYYQLDSNGEFIEVKDDEG